MAKKKGFFGAVGRFLGSIPAVGKAKKAAKSVKKKAKAAKKKIKKAVKKAKKKLKKKIGKVFTKARKLKNNLSKSKLVKKIKRTVKKAVIKTKKAVKKAKSTAKVAAKSVKQTTKTAVQQVKQTAKVASQQVKKKAEAVSKELKSASKTVQHALLPKAESKTLENSCPRPTKTYSVHDGEPVSTFESRHRVLGGKNPPKLDGFAPTAILGYSLVEDFVTLLDPNATPEEYREAALSAFSPVGKAKKVKKAWDTIEGMDTAANLVQGGNKVNNASNLTQKEKDQFKAYIEKLDKGTTKPLQKHHYATNKSKKYTPQMENITKKYGLDLDDEWNKELLPHQGRHPNAYHDYVLDKLSTYDRLAKGDREKFLKLYEGLKQEVRDNPDMLYKEYWRSK